MDIMQKAELLDKHLHLFTDNFYTNIPLAEKLFSRNTYLTGTINNKRSKRMCKEAFQHKIGAKDSVYFRKNEILLVVFKQAAKRKPVYVLTTAGDAEETNVTSKRSLGVKPLLIHTYNQFMGGVDNSDKSIYHLVPGYVPMLLRIANCFKLKSKRNF
uniref:PiggyBac transposable element-derived protein domain-containing protein n=1 Tax=Graphocephala atropunctata TaxID=36148 RepID=A0A1B6K9E3_9HEMI